MSFKIHSIDDNRISGIEYLPCGAITPKVGMALVQSGGNLALATGTNAPTYISMCEKDSPCTAGDIIPVIRVNKDMIFETTFAAVATSVKLGDKVTLQRAEGAGNAFITDIDGLQVTGTTASGVAEVVYMDGTAAGDMCRVRF